MKYDISGKNIDLTEGLKQAIYDKLGIERRSNNNDPKCITQQICISEHCVC